ncbi:hypothetical protein [Robertkochia aurantiaca]|uniref:hypothetical protein n=1 Tax=Robertkochia aurantiaca TaxID=2873700 RepID=UPI001CD01D86|nr:hypothetical protein [Robertkochia sp. 3YJGBD-33]
MRHFFLIIILFSQSALWSQYVIQNEDELTNLKKLPLEIVYISYTGSVVFPGEYLKYAFYCINAESRRSSSISKVGYVSLVNSRGEFVLKQKIKLQKGFGQGDLFIGTDLPSGNYKLLGYTQWMKNIGLSQVYQDDITIINPYRNDHLRAPSARDSLSLAAFQKKQPLADSATIGLQTGRRQYRKREKIELTLKNYKGKLGYGTYTIKVKRKSPLKVFEQLSAMEFGESYPDKSRQIPQQVGDSIFLPEQRGELLYGTAKQMNGEPAVLVPLVISIPGEQFILKFSTTDSLGNFYTYLRKDYKGNRVVVQPLEEERKLAIQVGSPKALNVTNLDFPPFYLDESMRENILKRSVHNQVENQFFTMKPDSIQAGDIFDPFNGGLPEVFELDDYTRFPTFEETLIEILNTAGYRRNKEGNHYIRILQDFETYNEGYNDFPAIVLIDGVFIRDHESIKDFDARKIKSVSLVRDQFQIADKQFQGIMAIETFEGDYANDFNTLSGVKSPINAPQPTKQYFVQRYEDENKEYARVPDYRDLLLWQPFVEIKGSSLDFSFFTSDLTGEFEIFLDGFTSYGKPVSLKKSFIVKD